MKVTSVNIAAKGTTTVAKRAGIHYKSIGVLTEAQKTELEAKSAALLAEGVSVAELAPTSRTPAPWCASGSCGACSVSLPLRALGCSTGSVGLGGAASGFSPGAS